jgi:hypothetical protein
VVTTEHAVHRRSRDGASLPVPRPQQRVTERWPGAHAGDGPLTRSWSGGPIDSLHLAAAVARVAQDFGFVVANEKAVPATDGTLARGAPPSIPRAWRSLFRICLPLRRLRMG